MSEPQKEKMSKQIPEHNCRDTWKCDICGREIKEPCDFDDDYS